MTADAETRRAAPSWWLRALLVLGAPRTVFAALRDDSDDEADERVEPILAILLLAGVAAVLATPVAARFLDSSDRDDPLLLAAWAFIGGGAYAVGAYWLGGLLLRTASRRLGSLGSARRSRHLLAFAGVPLALAILLWPVRLALYGDDSFRRGGADAGAAGARALDLAHVGLALWALALVLVGVRTVHGWTWRRAAAAVALAASLPVLLAVLGSL